MSDIYVGLVHKALMEQSPRNSVDLPLARKVYLSLPADPTVFQFELKQPPYFWLRCVDRLRREGKVSIATEETPIVTPGGGALSFFLNEQGQRTHAVFAQKDEYSPRDKFCRVARSGFPSSQDEWHTMDHIYREAFEEAVMLDKSTKELLLPQEEKYDHFIYPTVERLVSKTGLEVRGTRRIPIRFNGGNDLLHIMSSTADTVIKKGVVIWTPETGFNFLQMMDVQYPVEEVLVIDGETLPDGTPLCRNICTIDLQDLRGKIFGDPVREKVQIYKNGQIMEQTRVDPFLTDKVPRAVLNQVRFQGEPIYPIDWMEESYQFLSRAGVLGAHARFEWSALEKKIKLGK